MLNLTRSVGTSDALLLPREQKRQLCIDLLAEFGVHKFTETRSGELMHRCTLNLGGHSDGSNPISASINYDKLAFSCFVCGYGGRLLWWVAVNRGLEVEQVEPWLKDRMGLGGNSLDLSTQLAIINSIVHPPAETDPMPLYSDKILTRWNHWGMFHPYMTDPAPLGRHIPEKNLERYEIGYADEDPDFRYQQRIIIPARWKGKIVGWQARALDPDDPDYSAKYKNSPDFPRERILYGEVDSDWVVAVESPMSVLQHCHHLPMVSTFGAKVTDAQLRLFHKYKRVVTMYDNDLAGWKATERLQNKLSRYTQVDAVVYKWRQDPAELDDEEMDRLVSNAIPAWSWSRPAPEELTSYIN